MTTFEENLNTILKGVYGRDVRQAIHDAIEQCFTDSRSESVDLVARNRINQMLGSTGNLVETPLLENDLILYAYDQTFTIDPAVHLLSDYDYIAVYFKTVNSAAPEVKWFKASDFLLLPVVLSTVFLENAGHKLSAREIHVRCTDADDQSFEVYLANNWKLNGSDAADGGTYTEIETTATDYKAGVISQISGIKFNPSAEIEDVRIGEDGTVYESAGDAVRGQISDLKSLINQGMPREVKLAMDTLFANMAVQDDGVYSDEYAVFHAWATAINLESISAVFTQGANVVYDTDSLDSLKQYLVVTATYDDESTATITTYTLSGSLDIGTSTITVSYEGKSATFDVTVTERIDFTPSAYVIGTFGGTEEGFTYDAASTKRLVENPIGITGLKNGCTYKASMNGATSVGYAIGMYTFATVNPSELNRKVTEGTSKTISTDAMSYASVGHTAWGSEDCTFTWTGGEKSLLLVNFRNSSNTNITSANKTTVKNNFTLTKVTGE